MSPGLNFRHDMKLLTITVVSVSGKCSRRLFTCNNGYGRLLQMFQNIVYIY